MDVIYGSVGHSAVSVPTPALSPHNCSQAIFHNASCCEERVNSLEVLKRTINGDPRVSDLEINAASTFQSAATVQKEIRVSSSTLPLSANASTISESKETDLVQLQLHGGL